MMLSKKLNMLQVGGLGASFILLFFFCHQFYCFKKLYFLIYVMQMCLKLIYIFDCLFSKLGGVVACAGGRFVFYISPLFLVFVVVVVASPMLNR